MCFRISILSFDCLRRSPVMKVLTGLETLLSKAGQWQDNTSKRFSIQSAWCRAPVVFACLGTGRVGGGCAREPPSRIAAPAALRWRGQFHAGTQ